MRPRCLLCIGETYVSLDLGETPLANELPMGPGTTQDLFPLRLLRCRACDHYQLDHVVPRDRLYREYLYVSDTGEDNRRHFAAYAEDMVRRFAPQSILDIGSNDGLFLSMFDPRLKRVGVDPAENIAAKALVRTVPAFFDENVARELGTFDLITCNNAFAHNGDLRPICAGVRQALAPRGVFVIEVAYAPDLFRDGRLDGIYHEHVHHWCLQPLFAFLEGQQLYVFDVERIGTHGSSLRVLVAPHPRRPHPRRPVSQAVIELLDQEVLWDPRPALPRRLDVPDTFAILGYPAKACTLLHQHRDVWPRITAVYDDNPHKIGRYSHTGHKIQPTSDIAKDKPSTLLVLAWNYADRLIAAHQHTGARFIVP